MLTSWFREPAISYETRLFDRGVFRRRISKERELILGASTIDCGSSSSPGCSSTSVLFEASASLCVFWRSLKRFILTGSLAAKIEMSWRASRRSRIDDDRDSSEFLFSRRFRVEAAGNFLEVGKCQPRIHLLLSSRIIDIPGRILPSLSSRA